MKEGPGAGGFHGSDPFDIFNMFFGGGGGASPFGSRQEHRGKNLVHQLAVSLEELYNGAVRKLALQKNVVCDKCEGKRVNSCLVEIFFFPFRSWWKKRCCIKMYNL
jgi:DnaJ family protein A protein 1